MYLAEIIVGKGIKLSDLIEVMTSASIVTIVTIMTVALPLIVTSMHKLVELYKTNYVMNIFNSDSTIKWFRWLLIAAVSFAIAWVVLFFLSNYCWLYWLSITLCGATLALLICMIAVVARVVKYTLPNKFTQILFKKIDKCKPPKFYFEKEVYKPSFEPKAEKKRLQKYYKTVKHDTEATFLFVVLARIYVSTTEETVREDIRQYWDKICRKASCQKDGYNYYTNGYYNFIHEIENWAIDHEDVKLQQDAIAFTSILLKAHLPKQRKINEPESHIDERKFMSYDTMKSLWKTIRISVDKGNEAMFQRYWQIVNNMSSIKYESIAHYNDPKDFSQEHLKMYVLHYSCCAYLIASERNDLLKYVLSYSQSYPFRWQLIPESVQEIIALHIYTKKANSNMQYQIDFAFSDDYNLYDKKVACGPIEQLTTLLLYYMWEANKPSDSLYEIEKGEEDYIQMLIGFANAYPKGMSWHDYLGMKGMNNKEAIIQYLQDILAHKKPKHIEQRKENREQYETNIFQKWSKLIALVWFAIKNLCLYHYERFRQKRATHKLDKVEQLLHEQIKALNEISSPNESN